MTDNRDLLNKVEKNIKKVLTNIYRSAIIHSVDARVAESADAHV